RRGRQHQRVGPRLHRYDDAALAAGTGPSALRRKHPARACESRRVEPRTLYPGGVGGGGRSDQREIGGAGVRQGRRFLGFLRRPGLDQEISFAKLILIEPGVQAASSEQLGVTSFLDNPAVI